MKEQPLFHKEELVILLTVRNNRRLLQNALVCLDEIQRNRYIADSNRLTAYLWILVQPWISFDELSYTLLSVQTNRCTSQVGQRDFQSNQEVEALRLPVGGGRVACTSYQGIHHEYQLISKQYIMQKEQIDRFVTLAGLEMPALISPGKFQEAEIYEDSAVLTFLLPKVYPLEELIDELEDQMELILLYHYLPSTSTDFGQKCCAYSNPRFGRMYKLNATANGNIECDTLYVTLYDSLEIMGCELREELLKVIKNGHMLFARSEEELLRDFI